MNERLQRGQVVSLHSGHPRVEVLATAAGEQARELAYPLDHGEASTRAMLPSQRVLVVCSDAV